MINNVVLSSWFLIHSLFLIHLLKISSRFACVYFDKIYIGESARYFSRRTNEHFSFTIFKCFYQPNMVKNYVYLKRCVMFWRGYLCSWVLFVRFLVFEIWSILYFTFVMHPGLNKKKIRIWRGKHSPTRLHPWIPHAFGLRTLASLVNVWVRFAKTSSRFFASSHFTVNHR